MPIKRSSQIIIAFLLSLLLLWLSREWWLNGLAQIILYLQRWQNMQQRELTRLFIQSAQGSGISFALVFTAWLYGVIHAAGPGHGKALITTWTLTQREKLFPAILTAISGALLQAISALLWVGVTIGLASWLIRDSLQQTYLLNQIGHLLIIAAGVYLLLSQKTKHKHSHNCHCGHAHHHTDNISQQKEKKQKIQGRIAIALGIGIRPCSGALLILAIAASRGLWTTGILMTFAMAIGTAMTISTVAILTATGRRQVADRLMTPTWYPWFARLGGLLMMSFGLMLFLSAFTQTTTPVYLVK